MGAITLILGRRRVCVYRYNKAGRFEWKSGSLYHELRDVVRDLGNFPKYPRVNVLLRTDFRYFGKIGNDEYKAKFPRVWRAVAELGRGHRVHESKVCEMTCFV